MAIQDFTAGQILTAAQMNSLQANDYNWTVSTKTASYVLVAADKGTRVVMNAAGATTITVNDSLFSAGDTLFIQNIGAGTCTITAGTATVTTASSLALAQWGGGTLYFTSAGAAIFFSGGGASYGTGTGGIGSPTSVTIGGINYQYLQFNSTGTLTITKSGLFDVLAISGGTTGDGQSGFGGGGGSGVVMQQTIYLATNQTVTVGAAAGARANYTDPNIGNYSGIGTTSINSLLTGIAVNILNGAATCAFESYGGNVGSGYGGTRTSTATENYSGFRGGSGVTNAAGGGGGYSARGADGVSTTGGAGGAGYDVSAFIGGSALYKAAGGGGRGSGAGGAGGSGVGGAGGTTTGTAAAANTGSGGGGSVNGTAGGLGGSGIVYVRFKV